jgi:hypothetical protein
MRTFLGIRFILVTSLMVPCIAAGVQAQSAQASAAVGTVRSLPDVPVPQEAVQPRSGSVSGTVVDKDGAVVTKARITLTVQASENGAAPRETLSDNEGHFAFSDVAPGPFELTVNSPGFAKRKVSGTLQPAEDFVLPSIGLVVATEVDMEVTVSPEEVAEEQIHEEEKQRVFGVFPNFYVSYVPDAAPLNARQKFQLAWKATVDPISFAVSGLFAGLEQADDFFPGYGQGAQGYAKRFGANYADMFFGTFIGGAILPTVLKQDPRYFYKGTGTRKSRLFYAVKSSVVCKGDNGQWQPNYSSMLGALAAGGLSNLYYPAGSRNGVGLTFENALIGIGGSAFAAIFQEFFLRRMTPHEADSKIGN